MKEALKLALDLAIMHHSDDGYVELRSKVRQLAKEALAQPEKGLFIDLIAQHEGLAEEMAQDEQSSSQEPVAQQQPTSPDVRDALLFCLWHHQGGSSKIGQPIRHALGIGKYERMNDEQLEAAKRVQTALIPPPQRKPLTLNEISAMEEKVYMRTTHKGKPLFEYAQALIRATEAAHNIGVNT